MKILVTGGMGYIGSHTCVELLNLGMEVVIVDNLSNSNPEVLNRIETITGKKPAFYEADVCDDEALSVVFEENQIDGVIHFAGLKAVGESVEIPERYFQQFGLYHHALQSDGKVQCEENYFLVFCNGLLRGQCNAPPGNSKNRQLHQPLRLDKVYV